MTEQCCLSDSEVINHPVLFLTFPSADSQTSDLRSFSDSSSLDIFLANDDNHEYSCRFISICQSNSWRPLQVNSHMLSNIIDSHGFSPCQINDLASCFYSRNLDLEDSYCIPFTTSSNGPWIEILYTIRYPEFKPEYSEWAIRQTGLCHRLNLHTRQSVFLLLSPKPDSRAHRSLCEHLTIAANRHNRGGDTFFALHNILLETHLPAWRAYAKSCEAEFLPIANTTFATYIDEPLRVGHDQLSILSNLEARCIKMASLLEGTAQLIKELIDFAQSSPDAVALAIDHNSHPHSQRGGVASPVASLKNHSRRCASYARTADFLRQRIDSAAKLLTSTLSFRDQVIAKQQNGNMLQLNKSAVFITTLTLIYAPASFAATFFGMNFFAMDQPNSRIVCTTMIWIYIVSTLVLTAVTVIFYYWLLRHDSVLFWRLAPKVHAGADWRALVRRFTKLDHPVDVELKHFHT